MSYAPNPAPIRPAPSRQLAGNLLCTASMLTWAIGFPAAEALLQDWASLPLIATRFLLSVLFLVPLWALLEGLAALRSAPWGRGLLLGGVGFGINAWLLLVAQSLTDPVTVAVIAAMMPVFGVLLEVILDGRRLTPMFTLGLALSLAGGLFTITGRSASGGDIALGGLAALASCFLFVWASRATVRSFPELSALGSTTLTLTGGFVVTGALFLGAEALGLSSLPAAITPEHIGYLALYAIGAMAVSQVLWIAAVGRLGVAIASFHINIAPFYVMVFFAAMGGGWSNQQALGAGIVALGVIISQMRMPQPRSRAH